MNPTLNSIIPPFAIVPPFISAAAKRTLGVGKVGSGVVDQFLLGAMITTDLCPEHAEAILKPLGPYVPVDDGNLDALDVDLPPCPVCGSAHVLLLGVHSEPGREPSYLVECFLGHALSTSADGGEVILWHESRIEERLAGGRKLREYAEHDARATMEMHRRLRRKLRHSNGYGKRRR